MTAAWIWGAVSRPPAPLEACIPPQVRVHVGPMLRVGPGDDVVAASARLRAELQAGIDRCIESYPETPPPGAWWMPAHLGGGAITVAEQGEHDARERESYRRTG